jgi:hypothetical protein
MNEQESGQELDLVQLALIAVEVGETVGALAHRFGDAVVTDDIGLRAVSAAEAREFFSERAAHRARSEEAHRQRAAEIERKYPKVRVVGVPAKEGATPFESLLASADEYVTPAQEFGFGQGGVATELLEAELAKGRRAAEERRRLIDERAKERAADKMKNDLGGRE